MSKRKFVRCLACADWHVGHLFGLTPPGAFTPHNPTARAFQEDVWNWFASAVDALKPIDVVLSTGDTIDGQGEKSGASELITSDVGAQTDWAADILNHIAPRELYSVAGTPYHTVKVTDWEKGVIEKVPSLRLATFDGSADVQIRDTVFNLKHAVGRSIIPHGVATAPLRDFYAAIMDSVRGSGKRPDVILRGHVHYYVNVEIDIGRVVVLPGFQGATKFGRKCGGYVNYGLVWFDVYDGGQYECGKSLIQFQSAARAFHKSGL